MDYVIGSKAILQNVRYSIVNPLMPHLPDHCHVTYAIKAILAGSPVSSSCSNGCNLSEHNRLLWDTKLKNKLKECLESQIVQSKLQAKLQMLTLRLNYLVKLWWKHVKKPAWKSNVTKLKPYHKITGSIWNVKLKNKTWNPLGNKFLRSQIIPSWGTFYKTKRRNLNGHADGKNESLSVRV